MKKKNRLQKLNRLRLAAACLAGSAAWASAHTLSLSTITAQWFDGTPNSQVSYLQNGSADASAVWGDGKQPSSLEFKVAGQPMNFNLVAGTSPKQPLGLMTHSNGPIEVGSGITDVKLKIRSNVLLDGVSQGMRSFDYGFSILETLNQANPCADGGKTGAGANVFGCADRVTLTALPLAQDFAIGTDIFRLKLLGFSADPAGTTPFNFFWTPEKKNMTAFLLADVTMLQRHVPEPAMLPLLGLGLVGLALSRRRLGRAQRAGPPV